MSQNTHKYRNVRSAKEAAESITMTAFRQRFEATRSFDLEDDMEFCPTLLTDGDVCAVLCPDMPHNINLDGE